MATVRHSGTQCDAQWETISTAGDSDHLLGVPYFSRRYAYAWYKAMKDLHGNAIRLHANLRPRFYLELADEMGIAILDESEIYASTMEINYHEPVTWERFHDHIDGMVLRDRNYPSVFGWSIANEILSALWWKGMPRKFWPPVLDKVVALADRIRVLDPTRPWISSDGDGDFHGRLPTYIYHYGKPQDWNRQAPADKPFGIGEGGSMLWGSPAVFSLYNGERSYESRLGMQEGIAIDSTGTLLNSERFLRSLAFLRSPDPALNHFLSVGAMRRASPSDRSSKGSLGFSPKGCRRGRLTTRVMI